MYHLESVNILEIKIYNNSIVTYQEEVSMKQIGKTTCILSFFALLAMAPLAGAAEVQDDASLFPPNAEPGKCYAKVMIPAKFKTVTEELIKKEAAEKITIIPAQWEWVEEKVLVKEEEEKLEIVPATYKTVEEKVEIEPASVTLEAVEPVYDTVEEKVIDKPARTVWKKGNGLLDKVDGVTGEIMCLINEPASYKTLQKQVIRTPATVKKIEVPAKFKIVEKQVVDQPAEVKKTLIPAEYTIVKVKKLVAPAKEERAEIQEERQTVTKLVKESDEKLSWRPVLCQTNMTQDVIEKIQMALLDKGFDPGPVDGSIGGGTLKALDKFQTKNNLARGGLTYETLQALNIVIE